MAKKPAPQPRPRGRPRSASVDEALARAALEEFTEHGFHGMSTDSIAARAGVSKVSLYRRWSSKLDAAAEAMRLMSDTSTPEDHGQLGDDVRALLGRSLRETEAKTTARVLMRTLGELVGNPELLATYRTYLFAPRLAQMRALIERARARGELRDDVSVELAAAMIAGPLFLFLLTVLVDDEARWPASLVEELTRVILRAIAKERSDGPPASRPRKSPR